MCASSQTGLHREAGGVQNASKQSEDQQAEHSDVSQPATRNSQPATRNQQLATRNPQPVSVSSPVQTILIINPLKHGNIF